LYVITSIMLLRYHAIASRSYIHKYVYKWHANCQFDSYYLKLSQ